MENLVSSQPSLMIKLIATVLLIISSQTPQTTSLTIDLGLGGLLPPISAPTLIPNLLNFLDLKLALVFPVIQAFKNTITLDPLGITKTWTGSDICSYAGFYCSATPENSTATAVASVDFNGFGLSAPTLDAFLSGLPDLAVFHANSNKFSGTISPAAAKALTYLYELDISNNGFLGPFPGAAFAASASHSLTFLDARFNGFSGTIPPELFLIETLDFLFLNDNAFVGSLSDAIGSSRARYMTLANNKLSGPIPQSIGGAAATLTELLLRGNSLSGCLPYELGLLRKAVLFDAQNNLFSGQIPRSFQCMNSLEVLNLAGNRLYGALPEAICGLGSLANFSLSGNYFNWVGPACRKLIGLGILNVKGNCVKGLPEQRSDSECSLFYAVPRSCANANSFNLVPCSDKAPNRSPPTRPHPQRKLVSYAALSRRRITM